MKIFAVFIFFIFPFVLIQGVFAQEEMIQESYMHFPIGEKYFHYKTNPSLALVEEVQNRCWFTATFISQEDNGKATYQFPNDMIWPGAASNSTFFLLSYQTTDLTKERLVQKIPPQYSKEEIILNFEIKNGISQLVINSTNFFEPDNVTPKLCRPLFDTPPNSMEYYDKIFPPRIQQDYADSFGFSYDVIMCKSGKELAAKIDGSLACVSHETLGKLIQRGWAESIFESV